MAKHNLISGNAGYTKSGLRFKISLGFWFIIPKMRWEWPRLKIDETLRGHFDSFDSSLLQSNRKKSARPLKRGHFFPANYNQRPSDVMNAAFDRADDVGLDSTTVGCVTDHDDGNPCLFSFLFFHCVCCGSDLKVGINSLRIIYRPPFFLFLGSVNFCIFFFTFAAIIIWKTISHKNAFFLLHIHSLIQNLFNEQKLQTFFLFGWTRPVSNLKLQKDREGKGAGGGHVNERGKGRATRNYNK